MDPTTPQEPLSAAAERYRLDSERAHTAGHYALAQILDRAYQEARDVAAEPVPDSAPSAAA